MCLRDREPARTCLGMSLLPLQLWLDLNMCSAVCGACAQVTEELVWELFTQAGPVGELRSGLGRAVAVRW